jgi:hypothetical protein
MAGRIIHNLGLKALGNKRTPRAIEGKSEFQRLKEEGWNPLFLADPGDPRIAREAKLGQVKTGAPFDPRTGVRMDVAKVLIWTKENEFQRLRKKGWNPRFLAKANDPWIVREKKLGIQQILAGLPFDPATGERLNVPGQVLVWTK